MLRLILLTLLPCLFYLHTHSQLQVQAVPRSLDPTDMAALDATLGEGIYSTYFMDAAALQDAVNERPTELAFALHLGSNTLEIIAEHQPEFLSPDLLPSHQGPEGPVAWSGTLFFEIYRGYLASDPNVPVTVAISDLGISLSLYYPGQVQLLLPTYVPLRKGDQSVVRDYVLINVPPLSSPSLCGMHGFEVLAQPECPEIRPNYQGTDLIGGCSRTLELALDADPAFRATFGTGPFSDAFCLYTMLFVMASGEDAYVIDFNLRFEVTHMRIFPFFQTSPFGVYDLAVNGQAELLLQEIQQEYQSIPQSAIARDLPVLFTGNNCRDPLDSLFRGLAEIGRICLEDPAALLATDCIFGGGWYPVVVAHEVGHTLGALHPEGIFCNGECQPGLNGRPFMCTSNCGLPNPLNIGPSGRDSVNYHLNNFGSCLQEDGQLLGPELICPGQTAFYTFQSPATQQLVLSWSVANGLTVLSQTATTLTVKADNGFQGVPYVQAEVLTHGLFDDCGPVFRRYIQVGAPPLHCLDDTYEICIGAFYGLPFNLPPGISLGNVTCTSGNCSNLNWTFLNQGNNAYLYALSGSPGIYDFDYQVVSPCGTYTYPLKLRVRPSGDCAPTEKTQLQAPEEVPAAMSLQISPNPNQGIFDLSYTLGKEEAVEIYLLDLQGRKVFQQLPKAPQSAGAHRQKLDLRDLPSGIYLVHLRSSQGQQTLKMAVQ